MNESFRKRYPEFKVFNSSIRRHGDKYYFVAERESRFYLVTGKDSFSFFEREKAPEILKKSFPFLKPACSGCKNSFGFGDRTGYATAGHIRAARKSNFFPIFAQQSARELERTGRSFQQVLDDVVFWCFAEGWSDPFGADADHAKSFETLQEAISAGYTFFTIDPSDKIKILEKQFAGESHKYGFYLKQYSGKKISIKGFSFVFTDDIIIDLVSTYGDALDFVQQCYLFISDKRKDFDFEVSVDETKIPTSPFAHVFVAMELIRRKISFQSLALRFPGKFEKGIDYRGDIKNFTGDLIVHNNIRNYFGPYKISLHSGSDKFAVYREFRNIVADMFHVKTSGTSWIQAMKTIAAVDRNLFIECMAVALKNFEKNSASYEISADISRINIEKMQREDIESMFSDSNIRQLIHISYGSITGVESPQLKNSFFSVIEKNLELYTQFVEEHLNRHITLLS
ncbi:MAG: tagaturonate epimerase family protein [Candidatus Omnitrophica bacterium]|nr:tagaturonate epimerase family protein [Candidatus Omnitrophota bacterium]MCM8827704.1 tagaturonate epimerase family protein [Candidatus Omnitrophota bacterium]